MSIFDVITSTEIVAYWELNTQDRDPYMGEELWPNAKSMSLDIQWLKGASGLPVVLKPSALDVVAIPRPRIGFDKLKAQLPFFKESTYIDEELRQELNKVLATGNQAYIDAVTNRIFDDETRLLEGASAQRERMRMMMLTTGEITVEGNGQIYDYDYHMPANHKVTTSKSWSDPTATILDDIRKGMELIEQETGVTIERAVTSGKVMGYFRANNEIKMSIAPLTDGEGFISDAKILTFLSDELGIAVAKNDKRYVDENGDTQRYVPDDVFVMFPAGNLGNTWFGVTPEESDLLNSNAANVSITDTGVAVTTITHADPVQVETKVTMFCLPDFPTADQIYIIDVLTA